MAKGENLFRGVVAMPCRCYHREPDGTEWEHESNGSDCDEAFAERMRWAQQTLDALEAVERGNQALYGLVSS